MYKTKYLAWLVPDGIQQLFASSTNQRTEALTERLTTQVKSMFIKGKRLYSEVLGEATEVNSTLPTLSLGNFKNRLKSYLIAIQSKGSSNEWVPENFRLCIQKAKRKSPRLDTNETLH